MQSIFVSIAPIFGLLILGKILSQITRPVAGFWDEVTRLVYWVLIPALLFFKFATARFDSALVGPFAITLAGAFFVVVASTRLIAPAIGLARNEVSSVLQGASRHNTFIALALAERLYGVTGLTLAVLAAAVLVLATNLTIVPLLVALGGAGADGQQGRLVLRELRRNPILIAIALGFTANLATGGDVPVIGDMARMLGASALPLMLLCVGARLELGSLVVSPLALALATVGKFILFPLSAFLIARETGLDALQAGVVMIFAAVPTAASSHALARELGGDVPLMVSVVTVQTLCAFVTLPLTLFLAQIAVR